MSFRDHRIETLGFYKFRRIYLVISTRNDNRQFIDASGQQLRFEFKKTNCVIKIMRNIHMFRLKLRQTQLHQGPYSHIMNGFGPNTAASTSRRYPTQSAVDLSTITAHPSQLTIVVPALALDPSCSVLACFSAGSL